jgi:nitroreductase
MQRRLILAGAGGVAALGAASWLILRSMGSMAQFASETAALRAPLPAAPGVLDLIRYATLAANGHNTQPWNFRVREDGIDILPDLARRTPVVDPDDHHLFISLGCAAENLSLAAGHGGRPGLVGFDDAAGGVVTFRFADAPAPAADLFGAISQRQSTRAEFDGRPVSAATLEALSIAAAVPGVDLVLLTDRPRIDQVRDLVVAGNSA